MRFQVPQYIDIEDKLLGQLTFKQVAYLAGGIGSIVALYILLPWKFMAFVIGVPILFFGILLAFYRPNNKPLEAMIEAIIFYLIKSRVYLWQHQPHALPKKEAVISPQIPQASEGRKLKEKGWELGINSAEENSKILQKPEA